jgi:hypothetical protein
MSHKERFPNPSGRFPSAEKEGEMRSEFLYIENNPLYERIKESLKENEIKDPKNFAAQNILALNYGLHFYNQISGHALYKQGENPYVEILFQEGFPTVFVTPYSNITYVNYAHPNFIPEFFSNPVKSFPFIDDPEIEFPSFITQILSGLEEANHLHLEKMQAAHGANTNSATDHESQDLWKESSVMKYRSVLWHEFAAGTVQHAYIKYYLLKNFPVSGRDFVKFYRKIKISRRKWVEEKTGRI